MKIKTKMLVGSALLAAVPVLVASITISSLAYNESYLAVQQLEEEKLIAIRDAARSHIEDQFSQYRQQAVTYSSNGMIIDAMREFKQAFISYPENIGADPDQLLPELASYYVDEFSAEYKSRNNGGIIDVSVLYEEQSVVTTALQYTFIHNNPNPLGSKHLMDDPADGSHYAQLHRRYHGSIRRYLEQFEYYDIFLVDADSGNIVYSVFKELDYATSLKTGPFKDSGLAKAFFRAVASDDPDFAYLQDFTPYTPSYEDPAAFIASPIYDGEEKIGALIFQVPIDQVNRIMTYDQQWKDSGLGESGETYLVGHDKTMRSMSRFLIEDPDNYYHALEQSGLADKTLDLIRSKATSIGLQPINTAGADAAINGNTGFGTFSDYRGVSVLSAYAPLNIQNVNWAILSEIDEEEAYRSVTRLGEKIMVTSLVVVTVVLLLSIVIGQLFSRAMLKPILALSHTLQDIEQDTDLRHRVSILSDDEMGVAGRALNSMMENFCTIFEAVNNTVNQVVTSSQEAAKATEESNTSVMAGKDELTMLATAMTEMTVTIQEIALQTSQAAQFANDTKAATTECQKMMRASITSLQHLSSGVNEGAEVIRQLEANSNDVTQVLDVIRSVAEQTNLLALNAAIEAARAGEQGRGFAVVADEVRTLAQRTQKSTEEIQGLIESLQTGAGKAVVAMERSREEVATSVDLSDQTNKSLQDIVDISHKINDVTITVASATEQQSASATEIQANTARINDMFDRTSVAMAETASSSQNLEHIAQDLQALANKFKT